MNVEQLFYTLGSIVMVLLMISIITVTVLLYVLYQKLLRIQQIVKLKATQELPIHFRNLSTKAGIVTLFTVIFPMFIRGLNLFRRGK